MLLQLPWLLRLIICFFYEFFSFFFLTKFRYLDERFSVLSNKSSFSRKKNYKVPYQKPKEMHFLGISDGILSAGLGKTYSITCSDSTNKRQMSLIEMSHSSHFNCDSSGNFFSVVSFSGVVDNNIITRLLVSG